jgi:hypothetical protein
VLLVANQERTAAELAVPFRASGRLEMAMMQNHTFFREKAIQKYVQSREKTVLPHLVSPPTFALLWVLLATMLAAGILSWLGQTPLYVTASGLMLDKSATAAAGKEEAVALILLPATERPQVHAGMPVQVQIGSAALVVAGTIDTVEPGLLSPSQVQQRYTLVVPDPEVVATIRLEPSRLSPLFAGSPVLIRSLAGSPVHAQIQVGETRLLALLPFIGFLFQ